MALFKKKEKKAATAAPKVAVVSVAPKQPKPNVPPNVYTLLLGLAALFLIVSASVLIMNYLWS